jgi:hypothetical protein
MLERGWMSAGSVVASSRISVRSAAATRTAPVDALHEVFPDLAANAAVAARPVWNRRSRAATPPHPSFPFAPSLHARAFLLGREEGNLFIYSVSDIASVEAAIEDLGGISPQYMNHRHEAAFASSERQPYVESLELVRGTRVRRTRAVDRNR